MSQRQIDRDRIRTNLVKYTRKAYERLPRLNKPRILDIGCGSGVPTVELARLSNGYVIGLDNDSVQTERLQRKLEKEGLTDRVEVVHCSMFEMSFPDASFDIVWAEGSIAAIGFRRGLEEWRRLLKPKRYLVVHDEAEGLGQKLELVNRSGYELLDHFVLTREVWWNEYYAPLEEWVRQLRERLADDPDELASLTEVQHEVEFAKEHPHKIESVFIIIQKTQPGED